MRLRRPGPVSGEWLFNGKLYPSEAEYEAAREAATARRARLEARILAERDGQGEDG